MDRYSSAAHWIAAYNCKSETPATRSRGGDHSRRHRRFDTRGRDAAGHPPCHQGEGPSCPARSWGLHAAGAKTWSPQQHPRPPRVGGGHNRAVASRLPTAPIAALGLVAGYGVAVASGSRPLGGVVLAACGIACIVLWRDRDGSRVAIGLAAAGLLAFALSHVLALVVGAWPAVLLTAAGIAALCWRHSDARHMRFPALR